MLCNKGARVEHIGFAPLMNERRRDRDLYPEVKALGSVLPWTFRIIDTVFNVCHRRDSV